MTRSLVNRIKALGFPVAFLLLALVLGEAATRGLSLPPYLVAAPSAVLGHMKANASQLLHHTGVTLEEIMAGFLTGSVAGISLAVAMTLFPSLEKVLYPLIITSQVVPKIAIAPILLLWIGYGTLPKVLLAAILSFFPLAINAKEGLGAVEPEMLDLARSFGASKRQILWEIRLSYSLPYIFSGLKIAMPLAFAGAVIGEFVGASSGLGYLIIVANFTIDTPLMFSSLTVLVIMGLALFRVIYLLERMIIPWYFKARRQK